MSGIHPFAETISVFMGRPGFGGGRPNSRHLLQACAGGPWALTLPFVRWAPWTQIPWFLTGPVGNLVGRLYRGGGGKRLRIQPS